MTRRLSLHPATALAAGRYHLDRYGRLHATRMPGAHIVAMVTIRPRQADKATAAQSTSATIRAECAAEAAAREARLHEASRLTTAHPMAPAPGAEQPIRSLARKAKPSPVIVPAEELTQSGNDDAAMAEFEAKLKAIRARRAKDAPMKSEPKLNGAAIAAAHRAKPLGRAPKKAPTRRALTDGECHRCGIRTTVGCDHFLPYLGDAK